MRCRRRGETYLTAHSLISYLPNRQLQLRRPPGPRMTSLAAVLTISVFLPTSFSATPLPTKPFGIWKAWDTVAHTKPSADLVSYSRLCPYNYFTVHVRISWVDLKPPEGSPLILLACLSLVEQSCPLLLLSIFISSKETARCSAIWVIAVFV